MQPIKNAKRIKSLMKTFIISITNIYKNHAQFNCLWKYSKITGGYIRYCL